MIIPKIIKILYSKYCHEQLLHLVSDHKTFVSHYKLFDNIHLNSWEKQALFQEIAGHYYETATRYLDKATFVSKGHKLEPIARLIYKQDNLICNSDNNKNSNNKVYQLNFNITDNLIQLNDYLNQYTLALDKLKSANDLIQTEEQSTEVLRLERLINSYTKLIVEYHKVEVFSINKPLIYNRLIKLIINKKSRLLSKVNLGSYNTGTHTRHLKNSQMSIVKDSSNNQFQYFLKVRKLSTLSSREPKLKLNKDNSESHLEIYKNKLDKHNEANFIYLPLVFNQNRLKSIGKTIDTILSSDNPQILIKSEQLRISTKSRKIHIVFNYKQENNLAKVIDNSIKQKISLLATEENTLGCDLNLKHNFIADSNGNFYKDILIKIHENNKNKFIDNLNEIVELFSIEPANRTIKEKYKYEKLIRSNEGLLKSYLSGLIKDWQNSKILHLVLEDLNMLNDKSYYEHKGIKIKYTRLSRLLRFGQIKHWIASMAEKQGMFTHFVNPAYTSQECSVCHYISSNNRKNQE